MSTQFPSQVKKKVQDPFGKVVEKIQGFLKYFGMKITTAHSFGRRAIVFARRGVYPPQVKINIRETARGTAVSFRPAFNWISLLPGLSFIILGLWALIIEFTPVKKLVSALSTWALIDFNALLFGNTTPKLIIGIIFLLYGLIFVILDYMERQIRVKKLRQRFPYYTRNALWNPSDTPIIVDMLRTISGPLFTSYIIAIILFSPLSLDNEILRKLLNVYNINSNQFQDAAAVATFIIGGYMVAAYSGAKIIQFLSFRGKIDAFARIRGAREERMIQRFIYGAVSGALGILVYSYLIGVLFSYPSWKLLLFLTPLIGALSGGIAALAKNEGDEWLIGVSVAYFLASDMIFVFHTGNNGGFAWLIIITLMLLVFPLHYFVNAKFIDMTSESHDKDPSLYYSFFPVLLYVSLLLSKNEKKAEKIVKAITKETPKEETEEIDESIYRKIIIDKSRLEKKAPNLVDLTIEYLKLQRIYAEKQKNPFLIPTPEELIDWLMTTKLTISKKEIEEAIKISDSALWDPAFNITPEKIGQIMSVIHQLVEETK